MRGREKRKILEKQIILWIIIGIGIKSILEWITGYRLMKDVFPINFPMPPDVALIFIFISILFLKLTNSKDSLFTQNSKIILGIISVYGILFFLGYFFDTELNRDVFTSGQNIQGLPLWKMSPITGLLFFISGITLLFSNYLRNSDKNKKAMLFAGVFIAFSGFTAMLGYLYNTPFLYGKDVIPIAFSTALSFLLLGYSIILLGGNVFLPKSHSISIAASRLIKSIMPAIIIVTVLQGYLMEKLAGQINHVFYTAIICIFLIFFTSIYIIHISRIVFKDAILAEIELNQEHEFNKLLLDNLVEGVVACDADGRITTCNKVFTKWAGDVRNKTIEEIFNNSNLYQSDEITKLKFNEGPLYRTFNGEILNNLEICKVVVGKNPQFFHASGEAIYNSSHKKIGALITLHDITEQKEREFERAITIKLLQLLNERNNLHELIKTVTSFLRQWSKCEAVGIRLKDDYDYPYYENSGFPSNFIKKENLLCARDKDGNIIKDEFGRPVLECMCGNILCNNIDPSKPYFTKHGSFYINSTTVLLDEADPPSETRNICNIAGYESVALIPMRTGSETLGLIQLNDKRKNCFTPALITLLEQFSNNIALALHQRKTEAALKESEEKYRSLAESNSDYIMRYDKQGRHLYMNSSALKVANLTSKQILGKTHLEAGFEKNLSKFWEEKIQHVFSSRESSNYQFKWDSSDGPVFLDWRLSPELDKNGEVQSVLGVSRDITLLKKREDELRILSRAIDQNPASIVITNIEGNIEYVNKKFTELTGYHPEEVIGQNPRILKSGQTPEIDYQKLWNALYSKEEWQGEFINKKKNGEIYYESALISPIQNSDNITTHFIAVKEDITEKKKLINDLILAKEKAEVSDKLKSAFLANMSHEIRTPMNAILGFSELLVNSTVSEEALKKYAGIIHSRSNYLLALIEDILDLSKVEAGVLQLKKGPFALNTLFDELSIQTNLKLQKQKKNIEFIVSKTREDITSVIISDKNRIQQLLSNLIDNAIKFTHSGYIKIEYKAKGKNGITFTVSDSGIGVSKINQPFIFDRFHKSNNLELNYSGLGLGLSICKGIVKLMGGEIWIESELNKGSVFSFSIPESFVEVKKIAIKPPAPLPTIEAAEGTIMLVEDDVFNVEFFKDILEGHDLIVAINGTSALQEYHRNCKIGLILMDIGLPDMSGLLVTKKIRETNSKIPIIALTAYASENDKKQCFDAGCNDFISKPIDTFVLRRKIKLYMKSGENNHKQV